MQHTTTENNIGGLTMNATTREVDTITIKDLPGLRAEMCAHIENENFSDTFRTACQNVIAAIDLTRDDDDSTHAPLKAVLEAYVLTGKNEVLLHGSGAGGLPC
jgi:hypothetical protein